MKFIEQSFLITQANTEHETWKTEVEGVVAEGTGLGYYFDGSSFVVTHLTSGFCLGPSLFEEEDARKWIEAIAPLADWHKPAKDFFTPEYEQTIVPRLEAALKEITCAYQMRHNHREMLTRSRKIVAREVTP